MIRGYSMVKTVVIIDNNATAAGGTAQVAVASAVELSKMGIRVLYFAGPDEVCPQLRSSAVEVCTAGTYGINTDPNKLRAAVNGIWNSRNARELKKLLAALDPETTIVHIHGYIHYLSVSIFKVCKDLGFRTVLTLHDYFTACPCGGFYDYGEKRICQRKPMSLQCMVCNCDKRSYFQKVWRMVRQVLVNHYVRFNQLLEFICISEFSYSKIAPWLNGQNTYYVRNPYDLGDDRVYEAEKNTDYLFVGRLSEEKGLDIFCEAMSSLMQENAIGGRAIVVGDSARRQDYQKRYPQINFVGWKTHDEMKEYMRNARALVFPSRWYEGAPLTPVEFMAHGIPCIISDCCAGVEYISHGNNGLLFRHEEIKNLISVVRKAEDNGIWSDIASNLRDTFLRDDYSVRKHAEALLQVYEEIADKQNAENYRRR